MSVNPVSKARMEPNFENRLRDWRDQAAAEYTARSQGNQVQVLMPQPPLGPPAPNSWSGDLFDWAGMHAPFSRDQANADFLAAVADGANPGTVGDLIASTLQIDHLATMERAFRMRHTMRRPRAVAQMLGRRRGHGDPACSPYTQCGVEFVRGVLAQSKGQ